MSKFRIIPRLDIKGPNLVKGIKLEGLRALGKPSSFAKLYYEDNADELIFQDVVASLYDRNSLGEIISQVAKEIFIPLTVGGGVRSIGDIEKILRNGADKVSINTAATKNPNLIKEAALEFGSSTICISIEVIKKDGYYGVFVDNGREDTGLDAMDWLKKVQDLGAGEIVITSVDNEGVKKGVNKELIEASQKFFKVPVIYHGGVSSINDIKFIYDAGFNGAAIASLFHYKTIYDATDSNHRPMEGNFSYANKSSMGKNLKFKTMRISELKSELLSQKMPIRI